MEALIQLSFSQNLSNKITEVEERLDKLINAFLDDLIDKDTYINKKNQLVKTKADLIQKKKGFGKRQTIGTNRRLLDKKVLLQWEKPWEILVERDESSDWLCFLPQVRR